MSAGELSISKGHLANDDIWTLSEKNGNDLEARYTVRFVCINLAWITLRHWLCEWKCFVKLVLSSSCRNLYSMSCSATSKRIASHLTKLKYHHNDRKWDKKHAVHTRSVFIRHSRTSELYWCLLYLLNVWTAEIELCWCLLYLLNVWTAEESND